MMNLLDNENLLRAKVRTKSWVEINDNARVTIPTTVKTKSLQC